MSTTDPGPTSPTAVGSRPGGSEQRPQPDGGPRGSSPVRTQASPARPATNGSAGGGANGAPVGATQAPARQAPAGSPRPGEARPAEARPSEARPAQPGARAPQPGQPARPAQPGAEPVQRGGNGRILPPPPPGQSRPGQARPLQGRPGGPGQPVGQPVGPGQPGQPGVRPGQPRPGQPRPGQARAPRPGQPAPGQARGGRPGVRRGPRKARLSVARLDPWSVLKLSFLLSVALGIVAVVVTSVLWNVVNGMGVFTDINEVVSQVQGEGGFDIYSYVGFERMFSAAVVISVVNVAILTALATLFAFVYNISSGLVGGLHVTLTDE